jgi:hypothetical protein
VRGYQICAQLCKHSFQPLKDPSCRVKCDLKDIAVVAAPGVRPICSNCTERGFNCVYVAFLSSLVMSFLSHVAFGDQLLSHQDILSSCRLTHCRLVTSTRKPASLANRSCCAAADVYKLLSKSLPPRPVQMCFQCCVMGADVLLLSGLFLGRLQILLENSRA